MMDLRIIIGEISPIGLLIHHALSLRHFAQALNIVGVKERNSILTVREVRDNQLAPMFSLGSLPQAHQHDVEVIIDVEPIDIVRIILQEPVPFLSSGGEVLELILQDGAHGVESFLNDLMGSLLVLLGLWNLGEIIFGIVRISSLFSGLGVSGFLIFRALRVFR